MWVYIAFQAGHHVKIQLMVNNVPKLFIYDRDISGTNERYAMVSQSLGNLGVQSRLSKTLRAKHMYFSLSVIPLSQGDRFHVLLHEGALKGGSISHPFTSLIGFRIGPKTLSSTFNQLPSQL